MVHFYIAGPSFHFVFCSRGWIPCLHIPTPRFSPRKLSAQRQGKVFCQPLMAAPTVVTATHNRLHGHRLVVGSAELWADRSGGCKSPRGSGIPLCSPTTVLPRKRALWSARHPAPPACKGCLLCIFSAPS